MCLSTVYKNKLTPETIMMKNVMRIECKDGMVILTDLMERQMAVEGTRGRRHQGIRRLSPVSAKATDKAYLIRQQTS